MQTAQFPGSTSLASATYNEDDERLSITFRNGRAYTFHNVPQDVFDGLRDAGSPGSYFASAIKGQYG